jgi:limonene-1,2-epoxide hydrolase
MTDAVPTPRLIAIVDAMVEAYNAKDFERFREHLSPMFYFRHHNRDFECHDRDQFIAILRQFASEFVPDRKFGPPHRVVGAGNVVVREQAWGGCARVDIPGMAKAGEVLSLDLCTVYVFDGERVAEYHDYG